MRVGMNLVALECLSKIGINMVLQPIWERFARETGFHITDNDFSIPYGHLKLISVLFVSQTKFLLLFPPQPNGNLHLFYCCWLKKYLFSTFFSKSRRVGQQITFGSLYYQPRQIFQSILSIIDSCNALW